MRHLLPITLLAVACSSGGSTEVDVEVEPVPEVEAPPSDQPLAVPADAVNEDGAIDSDVVEEPEAPATAPSTSTTTRKATKRPASDKRTSREGTDDAKRTSRDGATTDEGASRGSR